MRAMRVVLAVFVACLVVPGAAALAAPDPIDTSSALPDIEVKGTIAPTKAQRADARGSAHGRRGTSSARPSSLVARRRARRRVPATAPAAAARAGSSATRRCSGSSSTRGLELAERPQARRQRRRTPSRCARPSAACAAAGGGLVTIGVDEGRRRLEGRLGDVDDQRRRDARRQGRALRRARPGSGGRQRRRATLAGADHRAARAQAAPAPGWKGLRVAGLADVQQARAGGVPDRRAAATCPPTRRSSLDTDGARAGGLPRRSSTRAAARSSRARASSTTRPTTPQAAQPAAHRRRRSPARCRADGRRLRHAEGPVHRRRGRRRARDRRLRQRRQRRATTSSCKLFRGTDAAGRQADTVTHARAHPLRARRRRPAGRLLRPGLRVRGRRRRRSSRAPTRARSRSTRARRRRRTRRAGARSRPTRR